MRQGATSEEAEKKQDMYTEFADSVTNPGTKHTLSFDKISQIPNPTQDMYELKCMLLYCPQKVLHRCRPKAPRRRRATSKVSAQRRSATSANVQAAGNTGKGWNQLSSQINNRSMGSAAGWSKLWQCKELTARNGKPIN